MRRADYDYQRVADLAWEAHHDGVSAGLRVAAEYDLAESAARELLTRVRRAGFPVPYVRQDLADGAIPVERLEYEIAQREPWMEDAACRGLNPSLFFPERGQPTETAKGVCGECPVREDCLDYSIRTRQVWGVWGGTSERERRGLRREARTVRVA
jgi:WhiB family redox-sensing transcriptional regulator